MLAQIWEAGRQRQRDPDSSPGAMGVQPGEEVGTEPQREGVRRAMAGEEVGTGPQREAERLQKGGKRRPPQMDRVRQEVGL